jgi:hypothetical protein
MILRLKRDERHRTAGAFQALPIAAAFLLLLPASLPAQVLPPIYKPLPIEEGERFRASADSLRRAAAEALTQAEALEDGARTLRQNGSGVTERLLTESQRVAEQASRLESQVRIDAVTTSGLQAQAVEFELRAARHEALADQRRSELALRQIPAGVEPEFPLQGPDPSEVARLEAEVRADSAIADGFRRQATELLSQAAALQGNAAAAAQRIEALRQQERQLRSYAAEIASGVAANEPTAARLEAEARTLRRTGERLGQDSRRQTEMADVLRVQADRLVLPVRSREDAMRFYGEDGRAVLRTLVFSLGEGGRSGSINSELVSDYAGPLRLGVGFVLAEARGTGDEESEQETAARQAAAQERFYAGGGNFVLYSSLPVAFHRSPYHSLTLQTLNKVALDVPGARHRGEAGDVPTNLDLGMEVYGTFNTYGGRIKAFGLARSALALGNAAFYANLGRDTGAFPYAQLTVGAEVASVAKVLLSGAQAPEGLGREVSLTFQVAR